MVLSAAEAVTPLLADERVAAAWSQPSALAELSVGGLAGHLTRATWAIEAHLVEPEPPDEGLVHPTAYFGPKAASTALDDDAQRAIRERAEAAGAIGPEALAAEHRARIVRLRERLAAEPATRRVSVMGGTARMLLDDYLPTRLIETVVHGDDLAASVGAEPSAFSPEVLAVVIGTLVGTAVTRHGQLAVIRAMTRRERDAVEALRVL